MKKIITLILGLCLCFALLGCGGSGSSNENYQMDNITVCFEQNKIFLEADLKYPFFNESVIDFSMFEPGNTGLYNLYKITTTVSDQPLSGKNYSDLGVSENKKFKVELPERDCKLYFKTMYDSQMYYIYIKSEKLECPSPFDGIISGRSDDAYYEDGYLVVPIHLEKRYMQYTVKNDKYTWYVRCSIGVDYQYSCEMETVKLDCVNNIVRIPEEKANENSFIKTRCRNVACVLLVTQKENGAIPVPVER